MARCFIGLGSNLSAPAAQLQAALAAMDAMAESNLGKVSSFYCSAAVGPGEQPDYVNAVAELETTLPPLSLLRALQHIESEQGRERNIRWGARTLDLDILLYDDLQIDEADLQVPHPRMAERNFVLIPLQEIAPELVLPNGNRIEQLVAQCPDNRLQKL